MEDPATVQLPAMSVAASAALPTGVTASEATAPPVADAMPGQASSQGDGPNYVYAMGRIEPRFPSLAIEKEFAQATARATTANLTDRQALRSVLGLPEHRYLLRQLCWVLVIEGLETYILMPRDPAERDQLLESLRPTPHPADVDLVIGLRGPLAAPELCNGLTVPIVAFDQIYSFDVDALVKAIPKPAGATAKQFAAASEELFWRIMQIADNAGATDEHRALNYLTVRYPQIYAATAEAFGRNAALTAVEVRPSALTGARSIVEVIFAFTDRATDVTEKLFLRVDVTEEFPFLVTKLAPYLDR